MSSSIAESYRQELQSRLTLFFADQAAGFDIPPAQLYRLEGFIDAGLISGFITEPLLRQQLIDDAQCVCGQELDAFYQQDYRLILHTRMAEAPVYPSTNNE